MVNDLQLGRCNEVLDGAPWTSSKTKCHWTCCSSYCEWPEGPSCTDWLLDRLWDLTQPISVSDCRCGVRRWWSWWSLRLQSDWTSAFRSAMTFFARTSVLWVLHHLVLCAYSHAICSFCSCRFGTSSLNSLMLFESTSCGTACGDLLSSVCHQRTVSAFPTFFY